MSVIVRPITITGGGGTPAPRQFSDLFNRANNAFWGRDWIPVLVRYNGSPQQDQASIVGNAGRLSQNATVGNSALLMVPASLAYLQNQQKSHFAQATISGVVGLAGQDLVQIGVMGSSDVFNNAPSSGLLSIHFANAGGGLVNTQVESTRWSGSIGGGAGSDPTLTTLAAISAGLATPVTVRIEARVQNSTTVQITSFQGSPLVQVDQRTDNNFVQGFPCIFFLSSAASVSFDIDSFSCGLL